MGFIKFCAVAAERCEGGHGDDPMTRFAFGRDRYDLSGGGRCRDEFSTTTLQR